MNSKRFKEIEQEIAKHQEAVGKTRDDIDKCIDELKDLRESCRTAWNDLQCARDALSELI